MQTIVPHLLALCEEAVVSAEGLLAEAKAQVRALLGGDGKVAPAALDREQRAAHGLAWIATYVEALRQMARWARALEPEKRLGHIETLIVQWAFGERAHRARYASRNERRPGGTNGPRRGRDVFRRSRTR